MNRLNHMGRAAWTREIDSIRNELPPMSYEKLAEMMEDAMREAAKEDGFPPDLANALRTAECSTNHAHRLCSFPASPLGTVEKRARVIGLADVLGVERSRLSRIGGGI